jgi:RNA polymerase sigma-70 factor, ECF subfamily
MIIQEQAPALKRVEIVRTVAISSDPATTEAAAFSDPDLVLMAKGGDRRAFDRLVERHYRRSLRIGASILQQEAEAQDQVQNAFCKAFERIQQFEERAQFSSWLVRIVENECLMHLRRQRRRQSVHLDMTNADQRIHSRELLAPAMDPERELVLGQMAMVLRREIQRLPPLLRNAVLLREIDKLPISEVAERLGVKEAAAKSRLTRAREELRARLLPYCGKSGWRMPASVVRSLPARGSSSRIVAA